MRIIVTSDTKRRQESVRSQTTNPRQTVVCMSKIVDGCQVRDKDPLHSVLYGQTEGVVSIREFTVALGAKIAEVAKPQSC